MKTKYLLFLFLLLIGMEIRVQFFTDDYLIDENERVNVGKNPEYLFQRLTTDLPSYGPNVYFLYAFFGNFVDKLSNLRIIPLFFGILTLVLLFLIGEKYGAGLFAMSIGIMNPFLIVYSVQLSAYSIVQALSLLSIYLYLVQDFRYKKRILGVLDGVGVSFHYLYFGMLIPKLLYFYRKNKPILLNYFVYSSIIIIPLIPLLLYQVFISDITIFIDGSKDNVLGVLLTLPSGHNSKILQAIGFFSILTFLVKRKQEWDLVEYTVFGYVLLLLAAFFFGFSRFSLRYISLVIPVFILLLAKSFQQFSLRYQRIGMTVYVGVLLMHTYDFMIAFFNGGEIPVGY